MSVIDSPLFLPENYLKMVQDILKQHLPTIEVWAYGSRVNGDYYDASDLDLVVRQPDDLMRQQAHLEEAKEAFVEINIPIIVQLVDWARIPKSFHNEILAKYAVVQKGAEL